uniref:Uncharacterized protein n=1 Tax=Glossina austeni TaxID=7395 RepID=A0A1A9UKU9_GLOAU
MKNWYELIRRQIRCPGHLMRYLLFMQLSCVSRCYLITFHVCDAAQFYFSLALIRLPVIFRCTQTTVNAPTNPSSHCSQVEAIASLSTLSKMFRYVISCPMVAYKLTLSKSFIFFGTNTSISDSNGPETILPFMYIIPPEPKTELCK